jgi:hypothetical protein
MTANEKIAELNRLCKDLLMACIVNFPIDHPYVIDKTKEYERLCSHIDE